MADSITQLSHRRMAIYLTKASTLDVEAGSEHSTYIFIQLLVSLSRFKMVDSIL
jgi:hypothetical protein